MSQKKTIRRTTVLGESLLSAALAAGLAVANVRLPTKTEAAWSVTRKASRRK